MSKEGTFLPAVIALMFLEYLAVVCFVIHFHNKYRMRRNATRAIPLTMNESMLAGQPFEYVYRSSVGHFGWTVVLLATRLCSFAFFFSVPTVWFSMREHIEIYRYFTHWNMLLITLYFLLATVSSMIGIAEQAKEHHFETGATVEWSKDMFVFGSIVQVLFEVAGGSALFITFVVTLFMPSFSFWNITDHIVTSAALILELLLNSMMVRTEHVIFNLVWNFIYLLFLWPAVYFHLVASWPYHFLYTDLACLWWYTLLVVLNMGLYFIWCGLSLLKARCIMKLPPGTDVVDLHPSNSTVNYQYIARDEEDGMGQGESPSEDEERSGEWGSKSNKVPFTSEGDGSYGKEKQKSSDKNKDHHSRNSLHIGGVDDEDGHSSGQQLNSSTYSSYQQQQGRREDEDSVTIRDREEDFAYDRKNSPTIHNA